MRFRGTPDSLATKHLEASVCCLIHFDNPLTPSKGVWLNPQVRVGYTSDAYNAIHPSGRCWPSTAAKVIGVWRNRIWRWSSSTFWLDRTVKDRVHSWESQIGPEAHEPGVPCLINEMQVLVENGWAHV